MIYSLPGNVQLQIEKEMWKRNEMNENKESNDFNELICLSVSLQNQLCFHRYKSIWVVTVCVCFVCIVNIPLSSELQIF